VIGSSAMEGGVITNGMSDFSRDGPHANSAVVVNVRVEDLGAAGPLAGLAFRRQWRSGLSMPEAEPIAHRRSG